MDITNLNVAIIGAAIGGCTAALLLARAGATVTLIEKVATPRAVGAPASASPTTAWPCSPRSASSPPTPSRAPSATAS